MEPSYVIGQILGRHAAEATDEVFQPLVAAVDGLDVEIPPDALSRRLVERFMAYPEIVGDLAVILNSAVWDRGE